MPIETITLNPDGIYHEGAVAIALDIPLATLARARRTGDIRFRRIGNRIIFLGQWVLDWLSKTGATEEVADAAR